MVEATEASSERSSSKLLLSPSEPIPAGSGDGHAAGPVREVGDASVMTYLRRIKTSHMLFF